MNFKTTLEKLVGGVFLAGALTSSTARLYADEKLDACIGECRKLPPVDEKDSRSWADRQVACLDACEAGEKKGAQIPPKEAQEIPAGMPVYTVQGNQVCKNGTPDDCRTLQPTEFLALYSNLAKAVILNEKEYRCINSKDLKNQYLDPLGVRKWPRFGIIYVHRDFRECDWQLDQAVVKIQYFQSLERRLAAAKEGKQQASASAAYTGAGTPTTILPPPAPSAAYAGAGKTVEESPKKEYAGSTTTGVPAATAAPSTGVPQLPVAVTDSGSAATGPALPPRADAETPTPATPAAPAAEKKEELKSHQPATPSVPAQAKPAQPGPSLAPSIVPAEKPAADRSDLLNGALQGYLLVGRDHFGNLASGAFVEGRYDVGESLDLLSQDEIVRWTLNAEHTLESKTGYTLTTDGHYLIQAFLLPSDLDLSFGARLGIGHNTGAHRRSMGKQSAGPQRKLLEDGLTYKVTDKTAEVVRYDGRDFVLLGPIAAFGVEKNAGDLYHPSMKSPWIDAGLRTVSLYAEVNGGIDAVIGQEFEATTQQTTIGIERNGTALRDSKEIGATHVQYRTLATPYAHLGGSVAVLIDGAPLFTKVTGVDTVEEAILSPYLRAECGAVVYTPLNAPHHQPVLGTCGVGPGLSLDLKF